MEEDPDSHSVTKPWLAAEKWNLITVEMLERLNVMSVMSNLGRGVLQQGTGNLTGI